VPRAQLAVIGAELQRRGWLPVPAAQESVPALSPG
jgi:hypothetical protein